MKYEMRRKDGVFMSAGFCIPFPPKVGEKVFVGSLSSRAGVFTSKVASVAEDGMSFVTQNNEYELKPIEVESEPEEKTEKNYTGLTTLDLLDHYTRTTKCWGVYVAINQFSGPQLKTFLGMLQKVLGFGPAQDIYHLFLCNQHLFTPSKELADKVYGILKKPPFYSEVFCVLSGPNGLVSENT